MTSTIIGLAAVVLTVSRAWPQFVRIVVKRDRVGVSLATWSIAVANHTGWLVFGVLSEDPIIIAANVLAGAGCFATVVVLSHVARAAAVAFWTALGSLVIGTADDRVLLGVITTFAIAQVVPQLIKVLRMPAHGVSTTAWLLACLCAISWIIYAIEIHRITIVIHQFITLPCAFVIMVRAARAHRQVLDSVTTPATSVTQ